MDSWVFQGKVLILFGPRRVGKTTFSKQLLEKYGKASGYFSCDTMHVQQALTKKDPFVMKDFFGDHSFIVLDEAQYVPDIGLSIKIFHDQFPNVQILATGSSSFELANRTGEPLTGRSIEFFLYPFSITELQNTYTEMEAPARLENFLRFGMYPEAVTLGKDKAVVYLENLISQYLYKDILIFEQLKKSEIIMRLLQLLAFQIGSEVSFNELASQLKINSRTVERYIDLLEKTFILFRLKPFSRNLRKEISKKEKIYFYDLGIRNAVINNFNEMELRNDAGQIWENFCIVERKKYLQAKQERRLQYFWRTHDKKEIDLIEEFSGRLEGFEFKWKKNRSRVPEEFLEAYPGSTVETVNSENYRNFLIWQS